MRKLGLAIGLAGIATLGASVPASADPTPTPAPLEVDQPVLGLDIRSVDRDGQVRILRVEDFPRR